MCSKVLNGHIILTDTSITTILAPEMTYTPNFMYESGAFEYATPEFIVESMSDAAPNDTYFSYQWNLKNVSYSGIDINYVNARNAFAFPYINDIIVAVVDNGV